MAYRTEISTSEYILEELRKNALASIDTLVRDVAEKFFSGDKEKAKNEVTKVINDSIISYYAVLHPRMFYDRSMELYVLFISADKYSGLRRRLEKKLQKREVRGNWYSAYGEYDYICTLFCNRREVDSLQEELELKSGFSFFKGDFPIMIKGIIVPEIYRKCKPEDLKLIELLQADCRTNLITNSDKERMLKEGPVISYTTLENYRASKRIKAFVGILIKEDIAGIKKFINQCLANNKIRPYILGVYPGGGFHNLLLEVASIDYYSINELTDELYKINDGIETKTYLVAEPIHEEVDLREPLPIGTIESGTPHELLSSLQTLYSEIFDRLPPEYATTYENFSIEARLRVLLDYAKLRSFPLSKNLSDKLRDSVNTSLRLFLLASVTSRLDNFKNALMEIGRALEAEIADIMKYMLQEALGESYKTKVGEIFDQGKREYWSLGFYTDHLIPNWKKVAPEYDLHLEHHTQEALKVLKDIRNFGAHTSGEATENSALTMMLSLLELSNMTGDWRAKLNVPSEESENAMLLREVREIHRHIHEQQIEEILKSISKVVMKINQKIPEKSEGARRILEEAKSKSTDAGITLALEELVRLLLGR